MMVKVIVEFFVGWVGVELCERGCSSWVFNIFGDDGYCSFMSKVLGDGGIDNVIVDDNDMRVSWGFYISEVVFYWESRWWRRRGMKDIWVVGEWWGVLLVFVVRLYWILFLFNVSDWIRIICLWLYF